MKKSFSNLTQKQIERLAEKNRLASQKERLVEAEKDKRGMTGKKKTKRDYVYVDRSEDPSVRSADHRTIFKEMKQRPFS